MREDQLRQIHEASLRVLGTTGVVFDSGDICQRFRASGFATEGRCVVMTEDQVATAVHAAPRSFELVARDNVLTVAADLVTDLLQTYERPPLDDLTRGQLENDCSALPPAQPRGGERRRTAATVSERRWRPKCETCPARCFACCSHAA